MDERALIIVAEDDPDDQYFFQTAVETVCPGEVETAFPWDGTQLLRILREKRPILDLLASVLVQEETIEGERLERVFLGGDDAGSPVSAADTPTTPHEPQASEPDRPSPQPKPRLIPGTATGS